MTNPAICNIKEHPATSSIVLIIGCGYVGKRLAKLEIAAGHTVYALARSSASAYSLAESGIKPLKGDLDIIDTLCNLPSNGSVLYYLAPPPGDGEEDTRLKGLLSALSQQGLPQKIVYMSTSGVYGDCQGNWVNESQTPNPKTDRAKRRLNAEQQISNFAEMNGTDWIILRVPGIYGPGRLPIARIQQGTPVIAEEDAPWSNRIHVDDLASICLAAGHSAKSGMIFNTSDGNPSSSYDFFMRVADLLNLQRPPVISLAEAGNVLNPMALSFMEESKRLDNKLMLRELAINLSYPTLDEGLKYCFADEPA